MDHGDEHDASLALREIDYALAFKSTIEPAMNLRRRSADFRAKNAFARLREAGVTSTRLAAIYLGVAALIEDDFGSHRVREFKIVQAAKAAHRLASGTHRRWRYEDASGRARTTELHVYPKSSGLVLRRMGAILEAACERIEADAVNAIIATKTQRSGPHRSHLPGWRPEWDKRAS